MDNKQMDTEAMKGLIKKLDDYMTNLSADIKILTDAANACDQVMGSDAIAQKYIGKLNGAIDNLQRVVYKANEVSDAVQDDLNRALDVLQD